VVEDDPISSTSLQLDLESMGHSLSVREGVQYLNRSLSGARTLGWGYMTLAELLGDRDRFLRDVWPRLLGGHR
jgi:hypothetical protein